MINGETSETTSGTAGRRGIRRVDPRTIELNRVSSNVNEESSSTRSHRSRGASPSARRRLFSSGMPLFRLSAGSNYAFSFRRAPEEQLSRLRLFLSCFFLPLSRRFSRSRKFPSRSVGVQKYGPSERRRRRRRRKKVAATISCAPSDV